MNPQSEHQASPGDASIEARIAAGFEAWGRLVCRHPWIVLLGVAVAAALLTGQVRRLTVDNSTESYFRPGDPTRRQYDAFREQFGQDERLLIAVQPPEIFDLGFLEKLRAFHRALEDEVPHVAEVKSMLNARNTRGEGDQLIVEDLLEDWPESTAALEALEARVLANPLYRNTLISSDATVTLVSIEPSLYGGGGGDGDPLDAFDDSAGAPVDPFADDAGDLLGDASASESASTPPPHLTAAETIELVEAAIAVAERYRAPDFQIHYGGAPLREVRLGQILNRDAGTFLVACLATIVLMLAIVYRRLSGVVLPIAIVLLALVSTIGVMALLEIPFSMTLQFIPTLILTAGICDGIHVLTLFYQNLGRGDERADAVVRALGHSGQALTMTTLTTAGGLLSFATASVAPVQNVGIVAPIGMVITWLYTLTLLPALLAILPIRAREAEAGRVDRLVGRALASFGGIALTRPRAVVGAVLCITLLAAAGALQLRFSLDTLRWYPEHEPVRIDTEYIDAHFKGGSGLEVVIDSGRPNGLHEPEVMERIEAAALFAESHREGPVTVGKATSIVDILKEIQQALNGNDPSAYRIPHDRALIAQGLLLFETGGADDLEDVVDSQFQLARMSVRVPDVDGFHYRPFIVELESGLAAVLGDGLDFHLTGPTPMNNGVFVNMVKSMFQSYAIALGLISLLMVLMIGNLRLGLLAMLPNLFPIAATLGVMGWMGVHLDLSSILLGGILLGIAVDDTIHFMQGFQAFRAQGLDDVSAIRRTLETTGAALLTTSLVLAIGFSIIAFSYMENLSSFGILACFATVVAFVSDVLFAPALLILFGRGHDTGGGLEAPQTP